MCETDAFLINGRMLRCVRRYERSVVGGNANNLSDDSWAADPFAQALPACSRPAPASVSPQREGGVGELSGFGAGNGNGNGNGNTGSIPAHEMNMSNGNFRSDRSEAEAAKRFMRGRVGGPVHGGSVSRVSRPPNPAFDPFDPAFGSPHPPHPGPAFASFAGSLARATVDKATTTNSMFPAPAPAGWCGPGQPVAAAPDFPLADQRWESGVVCGAQSVDGDQCSGFCGGRLLSGSLGPADPRRIYCGGAHCDTHSRHSIESGRELPCASDRSYSSTSSNGDSNEYLHNENHGSHRADSTPAPSLSPPQPSRGSPERYFADSCSLFPWASSHDTDRNCSNILNLSRASAEILQGDPGFEGPGAHATPHADPASYLNLSAPTPHADPAPAALGGGNTGAQGGSLYTIGLK